jgi:hypothetical protein
VTCGIAQVAHLPEQLVFYTSVLPLLAYYGLFATVIYPIAGSLHPMDLMNSLMGSVPTGKGKLGLRGKGCVWAEAAALDSTVRGRRASQLVSAGGLHCSW